MNIGLIIYLLGYICGMAFGIALSMFIDCLCNYLEEDKGEDNEL